MENLYIRSVKIKEDLPDDEYYSKLAVIRSIKKHELKFESPVTFFVSENGMGKSTITEAIAISLGFNAEGGTRNFNFSTKSSHSDLYKYLTVARGIKKFKDGFFLRAESFYNFASEVDFLDADTANNVRLVDFYGGKSLHEQSHGESFISLAENRFGGRGIYILDEPEAALSPMKIMRLMCLMKELVKEGSQFIISTHSPVLMTFPGAEIFEFSDSGIKKVHYSETEHFIITKRFMDAPQKMLEMLLD